MAHRYEYFSTDMKLSAMLELIQWEYIYDRVRDHQALNDKTPLQFLRESGIVDLKHKLQAVK
jgi:hypothetical protein